MSTSNQRTTSNAKLSTFADADLDEIVEKLTVDEAISLIAGVKFWWTAAVCSRQTR